MLSNMKCIMGFLLAVPLLSAAAPNLHDVRTYGPSQCGDGPIQCCNSQDKVSSQYISHVSQLTRTERNTSHQFWVWQVF